MALDAIYNALESQISGALAGRYSALQGLVSTPLQTAMAINLVIVGFAVMRGVSNEPFGNYLGTWLKCYLVILAATSSIGADIANSAIQLPDTLASALGGSLATSFDTFVNSAIDPAKAIHNGMEPWTLNLYLTEYVFPNPITLFVLILMIILVYLVAAIAMAFLLFVKFGLFVTVAVCPIFIGALIFPSSSGLFFSWLGAVLNYAIQTAAIALTLVFVVSTVGNIPGAIGIGGNATTLAAVEAMILQIAAVFVGGFLIMQASSIGSFAGGGGASAAAFLSAMYPTTLARKISNGSINLAGRSAGRGLKTAAISARSDINRGTAAVASAGRAAGNAGRNFMTGASTRPR